MQNMPTFELPEDFKMQLAQDFGNLADTIIEAIHSPQTQAIRLHPKKRMRPLGYPCVPWHSNSAILEKRPSFTLDPRFHSGSYYVQDANSMFLSHICQHILPDPNENTAVLDMCAAPGGKSTILADHLNNKGILVANEVIQARAQILKMNLEKWGYTNTMVTQSDPDQWSKVAARFDLILVDAPCSGEGLFRKDPDAINEWSTEHVSLCSNRQKRISAAAVSLLKEGGYLVYATCTYNDQENIKNIEWLCDAFDLESVSIPVDGHWPILKRESSQTHGYQFYPNAYGGEGFFVSVLHKTSPANTVSKRNPKANDLTNIAKDLSSQLVHVEDDEHMSAFKDKILLHTSILKPFLDKLEGIRIIQMGQHIGQRKKELLLPYHGLSLLVDHRLGIENCTLTRPEALAFLKKETFSFDSSDKGWFVTQYQGNGLGLLKQIGRRFNNYLPESYRIRMSIPKDEMTDEDVF